MLEKNPSLSNKAMQVDMPKLHEKAIIRMEPDEVAILLDNIENYANQLTGQKKAYFLKTKTRDLAIITLLLGIGWLFRFFSLSRFSHYLRQILELVRVSLIFSARRKFYRFTSLG